MTFYNNQYMAYNMPYDYSQFGIPSQVSYMNNLNTGSPMMNIPQSLMRPGTNDNQQRNNLGFQMNPVSRNKKKWVWFYYVYISIFIWNDQIYHYFWGDSICMTFAAAYLWISSIFYALTLNLLVILWVCYLICLFD